MSNSEILEQNNQKLAELTETLSQKALSQVPAGGTTDQVLAKASDADYDTKWVNAPSGGDGEKLYRHCLTLSYKVSGLWRNVLLVITTKFSDIITTDTVTELLEGAAYPVETRVFFDSTLDQFMFPHSLSCHSDTLQIRTTSIKFDSTTGSISKTMSEGIWDIEEVSDIVTEIV